MSEIVLEIGEVLLIGEYILTVVEISHDDVTFKIDQEDSDEDLLVTLSQEKLSRGQGWSAASAASTLPH